MNFDAALSSGQKRGLFGSHVPRRFPRRGRNGAVSIGGGVRHQRFDTLVGVAVGLVIAALVGYLLYGATVRLNLRTFFNVTSFLLLIFAAGLFAHGIHEFQEAGLLPMINEHLYDISTLIPESSTVGELLHAIVGFNPARRCCR